MAQESQEAQEIYRSEYLEVLETSAKEYTDTIKSKRKEVKELND
jgi:uncharacterized protein YnzC (UPF0291/DUF896 family)